MFAGAAQRLLDMGWTALLPLHARQKRPIPDGWERFNLAAPDPRVLDGWSRAHPDAGVGLALGPDGVFAMDLDFMAPETAWRAREIVAEKLGPSPLVRVGLPPKSLHLYRGRPFEGKRSGDGFEVFSSSGQVVLLGIHPVTDRPYEWPGDASPFDLTPADLPAPSPDAVAAVMRDLSLLPGNPRRENGAREAAFDGKFGASASALMRDVHLRGGADPVAFVAAYVAAAPVSQRHYCMVAAVTALHRLAFREHEYEAEISDAFASTLGPGEAGRISEVGAAIAWINAKAPLPRPFDGSAIAAGWRRGGR